MGAAIKGRPHHTSAPDHQVVPRGCGHNCEAATQGNIEWLGSIITRWPQPADGVGGELGWIGG